MEIRRWHLALVPLLVWAVVLVGCAKRPALTQATAPPPLGSAATGVSGLGEAGQSSRTGDQQGEGSGQGDHAAAGSAAVAGESGSGSVQGEGGIGQSGGAQGLEAGAGESGAGPVTNASVGRDGAGQSAGESGQESDSGQTSSAAAQGGTESTQSGGASTLSGSESAEGSSAAMQGGAGNGQGAEGGGAAEAGGVGQGSGGTQVAAVQGDGSQAGAQMLAAARPEPREFTVVPELLDVHFDFDRYDIRPEMAKLLDTNADWLKSNLNFLVLIEGHCDERGTDEYNLALGEHRAKAAMNYLVSQGVQASRMTVISYGEERPLCTEKTEACWTQNRRAHFVVKPQ